MEMMESSGIWATELKIVDGVERRVVVGTNRTVEGAR